MSDSTKYSNKAFNKYPKLILGGILLSFIFLALSVTELYLKYKNGQSAITKGGYRNVTLSEAIPNLNSSSIVNQIQSVDFIPNSIKDMNNFKADHNGFILPSFENKDPDFSIVFMGDATTASLHLESKDRFPYQVGELLNRKTNYRFNSYNGGYPGNDVVHSVNRLITVVAPLKPKMLVLMHSINDLETLTNNGSYWGDLNSPKVNNLKYKHEENSFHELLSLSKIRRSLFGNSNNQNSVESTEQAVFDTSLVYSNYQSALISFVSVCMDWDITPIILSQPFQLQRPNSWEDFQSRSKTSLSKEELIFMHNRMNLIAKEVATAFGVKFIDLNQEISSQRNYFEDFINLSAEGSRKAATIVSDSISLWIDDKKFRNSNEKLTTIN